jgi:hypothetical protein
MMTYERWREYIPGIVRAIASREHQEKVWLGPRSKINWVGDLYNEMGDEFFDDFFKRYSDGFTVERASQRIGVMYAMKRCNRALTYERNTRALSRKSLASREH